MTTLDFGHGHLHAYVTNDPESLRSVGAQEDWKLQHTAPGPAEEGDVSAPLHDVSSMMPDFYEHPEYYEHGADYDHESTSKIKKFHNDPEGMVSIYRSLPAEHVHHGINKGDWVTTSKGYALQHGQQDDSENDWPVIHARVPAKHLHTEGDPHEWGYSGDHKIGSPAFSGGRNQKIKLDARPEIPRLVHVKPKGIT